MSTVLKFPRHSVNELEQEAHQPSQVARMEDGFTRIPNALLEAIALHDLTKRQLKVLLIVARQTLGHGKSMDWVAGSQLEVKTGLPETRARAVIRELVAKSILVKEGRYVGVNMDISEWKKDQYRNSTVRTKTVPKNRTETVSKAVPKQPHTKETLQKKKEKPYTSETADAVARPADDSQAETQAVKPEDDQANPALKVSKYPACPHQEILQAWAEIMPEKSQPKPNLWSQGQSARNLAARWNQGFTIDHSSGERKLYWDRESGIEFWRAMFKLCRKSEFLMRDDSRWFDLHWIAKKNNFLKLLDKNFYRGAAE